MLEFWGVEVKSGESFKCAPKKKRYLHLSKACLVKPKKEKNDSVKLFVKFDDKKLVLGTLSADKCPQISYDVVFEKECELSHSGKSSVHFLGYKTTVNLDDSDSDVSDLFEMDYPVSKENGEYKLKDEVAKLVPAQDEAKADSKSNAKAVAEELNSDESSDDSLDLFDDDDFDSHSESDQSDSEDESDEDSKDESDEDSDDEVEDTPKAQVGKKREVGSSIKTPAPEKKAKLVTPSGGKKTDVKKGSGHTATPHPSKQAVKIPAVDKQKQVPEDESDEDSNDEVKDTPKKAQVGKKREVGSSIKTPAPEKKAKLVTPSGGKKTDVKKGSGHTATPHPSKKAVKTPAMDKQKQVPKSGGSVSCKSCNKDLQL